MRYDETGNTIYNAISSTPNPLPPPRSQAIYGADQGQAGVTYVVDVHGRAVPVSRATSSPEYPDG